MVRIMDSTKRLFYSSVVVVWCLTTFASRVEAAGCLDGRVGEGGFEVECSTSHGSTFVKVTCQRDDWATFPNFNANLLSLAQIHFVNCSYPHNSTLLDIFRLMNIGNSENMTIYFEDLRSTPRRQHFQNISAAELKFEKSNFTELPFDMLYDVLGIKDFVIMDTRLVQIPNNFFDNWSRNLRSVDLLNNQIMKIAKSDFAQLNGVRQLILYGNKISEIEAGAFDNLSSLEVLELGNNHLHVLPPGIFRELTRLKMISLKQNPFDELAGDLLTSIRDCHLEQFHMNLINGSLKTLPGGFFKNLRYLTDVQLIDNQLESLPADLFAETSKLQKLSIQSNVLASLPLGFFNSLENLEKLSLSENQITNLPSGIFEKLVNLKDLDISFNNLTVLESELFKGLVSLINLNASHNSFLELDYAWCTHLMAVEVIDFSFNQLNFGSNGRPIFAQCEPSLRHINISHNRVTEIIDDFVHATYVDLSFNELTKLESEDINNLQILEEIDLRNNKITNINLTDIATMVFKSKGNNHNQIPSKPTKFIVGNNPLRCDCDLMDFVRYWNSKPNSEFRQYVKFIANKNKNYAQDLTCASPPEFENFQLSDIRPDDLYCTLKTDATDDACTNDCICHEYPARKVLSVNCLNKSLTKWPAMISNRNNWPIELNMSHNMLKEIPSLAVPYFADVTSLDLSHNNISIITIDLFSKKLVDLRLHNNRISRLDKTVIKYLVDNNTLRTITLHENPWLCDCEARSFLHFILAKPSIGSRDKITCYGSNEKLYTMTTSEICMTAITLIVGVSLLVAFFAIILGILAALYYKYQREVKVWLYSKQWCLWFVTEDELDKNKKYDAFVSFSHKDKDFVEKEIVAKLEDGPRPYKLCLHHRDWLAGEWIPVQISQSVEDSRRTIVVLSPNFLESVWGRLEFRAAHTQALKEGRARVIIILYGEIENMDDLDPELKSYLSLNTYLKWGDPWFWDKLRYALPHKFEPAMRRTRNAQLIENQLLRQPVHNSANAIAKSDAITMSNLVNDSARLLGTSAEEKAVAPC